MKVEATALLLLAAMSGCAKPQPQAAPPPPPIKTPAQPPVYPKQVPAKAGDIVVKGCALTSVKDNKANCICRHASTQLDATDPNKPTTMVCRTK